MNTGSPPPAGPPCPACGSYALAERIAELEAEVRALREVASDVVTCFETPIRDARHHRWNPDPANPLQARPLHPIYAALLKLADLLDAARRKG